ncbi:hypothetical protein [Oceanirhabdus sp. W0125-5]|uniref:hypothetical protein n=1 Tax=Oceanirhabdus sp. W0125-5 TaxID=2999116 RepID=UPI0022F33285|nr:hypothetical protein [Oceanirhabdus sp. W0125-5]WBW98671.1 hypothetical protein OW730_07910 [Oceanirhabdus sp. W0125-5]
MGIILISPVTLSEDNAFCMAKTFDNNYFIRDDKKFDYIIGSDRLPHFRVLFWVPKESVNITPYTPYNIKTNVSDHGPIEEWIVADSDTYVNDMKLIYVFVPKRFILLCGFDFWEYVYIRYDS